MGKRRDGRMAAVQYLFANDLDSKKDDAEGRAAFWTLHSAKGLARTFANELIDGVLAEQERLDEEIRPLLENFRMERLAAVDRNVLRVAAYELIHNPDLPAPIILNEAIEIAKMLSAGESGGFVNGVLDKLRRRLRPESSAPKESSPASNPTPEL